MSKCSGDLIDFKIDPGDQTDELMCVATLNMSIHCSLMQGGEGILVCRIIFLHILQDKLDNIIMSLS